MTEVNRDNYRYKYVSKNWKNKSGQIRRRNPDKWITGPDPIQRDKYYAWLKHRAQAKYRGEEYALTWEDWQDIWKHDWLWFLRGRGPTNCRLELRDKTQPWTRANTRVVNRATGEEYE